MLFSGTEQIVNRPVEEQHLFAQAHHVETFEPSSFNRDRLLETLPVDMKNHIIITGELRNGVFHLIRPLRTKSLKCMQGIKFDQCITALLRYCNRCTDAA